MPELPEVETTCRGLRPYLVGHSIAKIIQRCERLRDPLPPNLNATLKGQTVLAIKRRAKYIVVELSGGQTLLIHLGMSGRLVRVDLKTPAQKHDHVEFITASGTRIVYNDPRRFGRITLWPSAELENQPWLAGLGVEPLEPGLTGAILRQLFAGKQTSLKTALLDQRLIAGLGNIYVSEALFLAGLHPARAAGSLSVVEARKLAAAIPKILNAALKAGGSSLRDYVQSDGKLGFFQNEFAVYDQAGKPCKDCTCNIKRTGGVVQITQGGRSTYFCPVKQKSAA